MVLINISSPKNLYGDAPVTCVASCFVTFLCEKKRKKRRRFSLPPSKIYSVNDLSAVNILEG